MAEDLISNTATAAIAYQDALTAAKNMQNALLRQYGFTAPSSAGEYTVESAQNAFDPNVLFDKATGGINQAKLKELAGRIQIGGTGALSDIMRGGAATEAEEVMGARQRGIAGGGLAAQRRALAEAQTSGQLGQARQEFVGSIGQALAPISGAYSAFEQSRIADRIAAEASQAAINTTPSVTDFTINPEPEVPEAVTTTTSTDTSAYTRLGTPGGKNVPKNPRGGQLYTGPNKVEWQYRMNGPKGKGWYRK